MNTVHGASDTIDFLQFFGEAGKAANVEIERTALEVEVMKDNCPTHHFAGGEALCERLSDLNIELVNPLRTTVRYIGHLSLLQCFSQQ